MLRCYSTANPTLIHTHTHRAALGSVLAMHMVTTTTMRGQTCTEKVKQKPNNCWREHNSARICDCGAVTAQAQQLLLLLPSAWHACGGHEQHWLHCRSHFDTAASVAPICLMHRLHTAAQLPQVPGSAVTQLRCSCCMRILRCCCDDYAQNRARCSCASHCRLLNQAP